jgi:hypothetical protein
VAHVFSAGQYIESKPASPFAGTTHPTLTCALCVRCSRQHDSSSRWHERCSGLGPRKMHKHCGNIMLLTKQWHCDSKWLAEVRV